MSRGKVVGCGRTGSLTVPQRPKMNLAQEALRALRDDGFHGVCHIFRTQHFRRVLCAAPGEFRGDTSWANHADADAMLAEIFRHTAGKTNHTPFGRAIDAPASESVLAGEGTDVDDVARATADHGRRHHAGNEENTLEIGIQHAVPVSLGFLVSRAKETDTGAVDEDGDGAEGRFCFGNQIGNFGRICDVGNLVVDGHTQLCQSPRGLLECGAIPTADRYGGSQQSQLVRDGPADTTAPAGDERYTASQRFVLAGMFICFAYSRHEKSSSYGPLFLCDTHPIIRVFRSTWDPLMAEREQERPCLLHEEISSGHEVSEWERLADRVRSFL